LSRSSRRLVTALAAATVATTLAACGGSNGGSNGTGSSGGGGNSASDVGITSTSIKLGAHYPLTGVAAPGYSTIPLGAKAYFDYVNSKGGVNGRKIEWDYKDDGYNPTNTSQVVNQLVLQDKVFALMGGLGTPTHSAVLDFLNSEGVPDLFVASGSSLWDQPKKNPETFGWQTDYESEGKIIGQYIKQNFPNAKVGLFLQDDDFGADGEKGVREFISSQIVDAERYTPGKTDVTPQVSALQQKGADFVVGFNVPSYTALTQLTALKLGYKPQWFYSNVGSDPTLVGGLLANFSQGQVKDATSLNGALTTQYLAGVETPNDPWVQLWQKVWQASGQQGNLSNFEIYGMAQAYTTVQALQAAGQNPTRKSLVSAVEKVGKNWQGPQFAPFRYSTSRHAGISGMKIIKISGSTPQDLSKVLVTDVGDAKITEYTGKEATPPSSGMPDEKPAG
jgi:branched-chain amino acid transport system substrate-binding protein